MLKKIESKIRKLRTIKRLLHRHYKYTFTRNVIETKLQKKAKLVTGKILDIGSKSRRYDKFFKGVVTAIDIEPNKKLDIIHGDVQKLDFPNESFDTLMCIEVLCYVDDIYKSWSEIFRVLKPGGYGIITIPFMQHDHYDNMRFTKKFMDKVIKHTGFIEYQVETFGNGHTVIWDIIRKKFTAGKPYIHKKIVFYLILLPWLIFIKLFKLDKIQDKYHGGLFITVKK